MDDVFDKTKTREMISKGRRAKWWERKGSAKRGFRYFDCEGRPITNKAQLERIASLVIPPAWRYVRICPQPRGRLQVVGMDSRGRIQYRYHPSFAEQQQRRKFSKIEKFGKYLPDLKAVTSKHLALEGLPKEKVLALIMRLINSLYFRVGTDHSVHHYKTYGITTLHRKHLEVRRNGEIVFEFVGKSHIQHRKVLVDPDLAAVIKELASLGRGRKLFRYVDEGGKLRPVTPAQVNSYLKEATDPIFSAKDFRTWGGSLMAALELAEIGPAEEGNERKKNLVRAVKRVAAELGNTPAVCRSSYIHPAVLKMYERGVTLDQFRPRNARAIKRFEAGLEPEEAALLRLFEAASSKSK